MIVLHDARYGAECTACAPDAEKNFILTKLATSFSEDLDFLRKVNKLTFGLLSTQKGI